MNTLYIVQIPVNVPVSSDIHQVFMGTTFTYFLLALSKYPLWYQYLWSSYYAMAQQNFFLPPNCNMALSDQPFLITTTSTLPRLWQLPFCCWQSAGFNSVLTNLLVILRARFLHEHSSKYLRNLFLFPDEKTKSQLPVQSCQVMGPHFCMPPPEGFSLRHTNPNIEKIKKVNV